MGTFQSAWVTQKTPMEEDGAQQRHDAAKHKGMLEPVSANTCSALIYKASKKGPKPACFAVSGFLQPSVSSVRAAHSASAEHRQQYHSITNPIATKSTPTYPFLRQFMTEAI